MSRAMKAEPPPPTLAWKAYVVGKANHLQIGVKAAFPCARRFFQVSLSLKLSPVAAAAAAIPEPKPSITHKLLSKSKMVRRVIGNGSPIFARIKMSVAAAWARTRRRRRRRRRCNGSRGSAAAVSGLRDWNHWIWEKRQNLGNVINAAALVVGPKVRRMLLVIVMLALFNFFDLGFGFRL